ERRQEHEPPVAELVAESLDDDPPVGRQGAGRVALVLEVRDEVLGRQRIEVMALPEPVEDGGPAAGTPGQVGLGCGDELAERPTQLDWPADRVAVPPWQLARDARR